LAHKLLSLRNRFLFIFFFLLGLSIPMLPFFIWTILNKPTEVALDPYGGLTNITFALKKLIYNNSLSQLSWDYIKETLFLHSKRDITFLLSTLALFIFHVRDMIFNQKLMIIAIISSLALPVYLTNTDSSRYLLCLSLAYCCLSGIIISKYKYSDLFISLTFLVSISIFGLPSVSLQDDTHFLFFFITFFCVSLLFFFQLRDRSYFMCIMYSIILAMGLLYFKDSNEFF
jgi:hypothetical protein